MSPYTALPDEEERIQQQITKRQRQIASIELFLKRVSPQDFVGLNHSEKTQYTHKHKSIKSKGGSPPKEYNYIEMLVDLQIAYEAEKFDEALPLYYTLKRALGYFND